MSAGRGELEWQRAQDEMLDRAARSAAHRGITLEQQLNVQRERAKQLEIARSKLLEERARMFDTLGAQNVVPTASLAEVLADRLRRDREDVAAARLVAWACVAVAVVATVVAVVGSAW